MKFLLQAGRAAELLLCHFHTYTGSKACRSCAPVVAGGVMEAAVRTVFEVVTGKSMPTMQLDAVRGLKVRVRAGQAGRGALHVCSVWMLLVTAYRQPS